MKLRQFTASTYPTLPWGGGHTPETDPSRNGWRIRKVGSAYLLAKRGDVVSASCRRVSAGWDVALYWNTPEDVVKYLRGETKFCSEGYTIDSTYEEVGDYPGGGLTVIELLKREREILKSL